MLNDKYATHIVKMVRNNGIVFATPQTENKFLMLDYFDVLLHQELKDQDKNYLNYFSIKDTFQDRSSYNVSHKSLSLYRKKEYTSNPFLVDGKRDTLSDNPFLGLIQICLCKDCYTNERRSPDDFLTVYENIIESVVQECMKEKEDVLSAIYRSSATGDFCLAVRTDSFEEIYRIAERLNSMRYFMTYTNVGIEYICGEDGICKSFSGEFIKKHTQNKFSLRFSADGTFYNMLKTKCKTEKDNISGLFGRYDYIRNMDMEQFAEIYPLLCLKKIGPESEKKKSKERKKEKKKENEDNWNNLIFYDNVRNINERVLVNLTDIEINDNTPSERDDQEQQHDVINQKNQAVLDSIHSIKKYGQYFLEESKAFEDLYRGLLEVYDTFSVLGMERDAYINWLIFLNDIQILCDNLKAWAKEYESHLEKRSNDERKEYRMECLKSWRIALHAINQYARFLHNVNYQTYQAPIYELQTKIDTEKAVVAYREAMEKYLLLYAEKYSDEISNGENEIPARIYPLIYPDLSIDKVEAHANFIWTTCKRKQIICTVPSFEYFGRIYNLLPWIIHESSHQIRMLHRKERNSVIVAYMFRVVFTEFINYVLKGQAVSSFYRFTGIEEKRLIEAMVNAAVKNFEENGDGYEKLEATLENYLDGLFGDSLSESQLSAHIDYKTALSELKDSVIDLLRREQLLSDDDGISIGLIEKAFGKKKSLKDFEEIMKVVLDYYQDYFQKLCRVGLSDRHLTLIDFKLSGTAFEWRIRESIGVDKPDWKQQNGADKNLIKEYCFTMQKLYRIYTLYMDLHEVEDEKSKNRIKFLKEVHEIYRQDRNREDSLLEPEVKRIFRNMGLLNKKPDKFVNVFAEQFRKVDKNLMKKLMEQWSCTYREACADLLMVSSMGMNSFGYCRQALHTMSDATIQPQNYVYESVNFERLRLVISVLLSSENGGRDKGRCKKETDEQVFCAQSLVDKGKDYCHAIIDCVDGMIRESKEMKDNRKKQQLLKKLFAVMKEQTSYILDNDAVESRRGEVLSWILHGDEKNDKEMEKEWKKFESLLPDIEPYKRQLRRIETFYIGLHCILIGKEVYVNTSIHEHMAEMYEKINGKEGCKWEKDMPEYLMETKKEVGHFYNDPKQEYESKPQQKLEHTIEFIQNYYYYNRFRVVKEYQVEQDDTKDEK